MVKYILIVILLTLHLSCSTNKRDFAVINDFLSYEMNGKPYDTIFIVREKVDNDRAVQLYEYGYNERLTYNPDHGAVWVNLQITFWPMDKEQIEVLKYDSADASPDFWKRNDFTNKSLYW